jgi:aspartate/glutamate racemase
MAYYQCGVTAGADIILNTCSSVSEVVDKAKKKIKVPILKIDQPMAEVAVNSSARIGVLGTIDTTMKPTVGLIKSIAKEQQKKVTVVEGLARWAFESLEEGNKEEHDAILMKTARQVARKVEILVLAQGSMARMERTIAQAVKKPVLSSPRLGVLAIKKYMK